MAEHAPQNRRGYFTSFIQTTATLGLLLSLVVILLVQGYVNGNWPETELVQNGAAVLNPDGTAKMIKAFDLWGWRIPFLGSIILLLVSLYIRMQMHESPAFKKMKEEGASVEGLAARSLRSVEERQDRADRASGSDGRAGRGLVLASSTRCSSSRTSSR